MIEIIGDGESFQIILNDHKRGKSYKTNPIKKNSFLEDELSKELKKELVHKIWI